MYYRFFDLPGLFARPNIQYILDPGGCTRASSAVVLGMRTDMSL
jgi:carbohydrate-selective porin OprB